ncbi:MAG: TIGR00730 family Rossman fold protein [Betaproteobacteria bacterium]|nr:TIGR00730 family Rossman fold protein [Betaproteobacteria bacterium]
MSKPKSICLFCSASQGLPAEYIALAESLGTRIAREGMRLVYGGSARGLMIATARAAHAAGGTVLGVMPRLLIPREGIGSSVGEIKLVETLSERKQVMADASDAFVAIPGGIGTLDEVAEMITWNELSIHAKPVYLLNMFGFWDPLLEFFERGRKLGVIRPSFDDSCTVVDTQDALFEDLARR